MARQQRIEFEGAFYHVMARGDRAEAIAETEEDREDFVSTMGRACERTGARIHAWVLMSNHYHWLLETPAGNLVETMRWFQYTYTRRFNVRNGRWGHVFGGRYKSVVLSSSDGDGDYFRILMDYIHVNPARAGMVDPSSGLGLLDYRWSSLSQGYGVGESKRPGAWMDVASGLSLFQCEDTAAGRERFVERLNGRANSERERAGVTRPDEQTLQSTLRRGWYWGSEALKESLLQHPVKESTEREYEFSEHGKARSERAAEEIVRVMAEEVGLDEADLETLPGSDPRKVDIALELSRATAVSLTWIARRLAMRSASNVSQQLYRRRRNKKSMVVSDAGSGRGGLVDVCDQ